MDSAIIVCQHMNKLKSKGELEESERFSLAFGISHGSVMLGIVGNDDRFSSSLISEQITASEYLKTIAWKYRALILITGTAAEQIPGFEQQYSHRLLGMMYFKNNGKKREVLRCV